MRDLHPWGGRRGGIASPPSVHKQPLPQASRRKWPGNGSCAFAAASLVVLKCPFYSDLVSFSEAFRQAWILPTMWSESPFVRLFFFLFLVDLSTEVVTAVDSLIPIPPPKHLCLLVWIFFS